ncbi:LuxR family transcriptional regulator [Mycobacterium sp. E342]|uniref:helix-turn-helix transcriptional regulator n=1 Tax=Mycobacterium sp. E342 TaxID=1834147 RepID=UPI0007FB9355|nr:LuxR family transcriptional regulator [Mycobacterium sp. E342]OBH25179.1 LuxR family transcriptional regulator [Mycobacterium sp. E342]
MRTQRGANWPVVARDAELDQAWAALEAGAQGRGVALLGESGVGKSTLARTLAECLGSRGHAVRFVLGTETGRAIPLGAFYRSLTVDATHEPAVMLACAHRTLERVKNLLLVVDDAQLLDPLSTTLVHQLAVGGRTRLIVVVRTGESLPDTVTSLWKEQLVLPLAIRPFTREQVGELARKVLGDAVDRRLVDELHRRTAGNLLLLRGLLGAGQESGVLAHTGTGWQLHGSLRGDDELYDLLEFRLRSLAPDELAVIEVIATAEVLDWSVLQSVCNVDAVSRLERRGLIQLVANGAQTVARLNHPVIGEAALQRAGVARARQLNTLLAQQLERHSGDVPVIDVRTRIQRAQFMMRSDLQPDLEEIIDAAASAVAMSNVAFGETLARFAFERGGGLPAAIVLAEALSWQGRGDEAEEVLGAFDPDGTDELLMVRWGCQRAANLFWDCGRVDLARSVLANVNDRVDSEAMLGLALAMQASFAFFCGDVPEAISTGLPLCESGVRSREAVLAAMSTAWALALAGRFSDSHRIADQGFRTAEFGESGPQRFAIGLAEVMAFTAAGDLGAADLVPQRYAALTAGVREAKATVKAVVGLAKFARGALGAAGEALHDSLGAMRTGFPSGWLMLVSALLAQLEAGQGHSELAAAALKIAEDANGPQVAVFLPELELARAWSRASAGQTSSARRHAIRAAEIAKKSGMCAVEIRALHTAVRFGDRSHAARLGELARILGAPLPDAMAAHARALVDHDANLLDEAAERFSVIGAMALAADAAAQAAGEHARAGERAKGLESSARARWLAGKFGLHSPAIDAATQPLPITDREREVAAMVAAGLSNREIADRLSLSGRTVDGHLYRIFAKLDIRSRDELARLMRAVEPGA